MNVAPLPIGGVPPPVHVTLAAYPGGFVVAVKKKVPLTHAAALSETTLTRSTTSNEVLVALPLWQLVAAVIFRFAPALVNVAVAVFPLMLEKEASPPQEIGHPLGKLPLAVTVVESPKQ